MPGGHLYGWYSAGNAWVKMVCNAAGQLLIDISAHTSNASAHHPKYTDTESRAAINDIFGADGWVDKDIDFDENDIWAIQSIYFDKHGALRGTARLWYTVGTGIMKLYGKNTVGDYVNIDFQKYTGSEYVSFATEPVVDTKISDHAGLPSVHHPKYTDAEALAACKLNGTLYWSCVGSHFDAQYPDTDQIEKSYDAWINPDADTITFVANVDLPHGATITACIVYGNAGAQGESWGLRRMLLSDSSNDLMATDNIGSEDSTITEPVVNNSTHAYFLHTTTMDTNDKIYGARISYTL